jgi:hypothetical protein
MFSPSITQAGIKYANSGLVGSTGSALFISEVFHFGGLLPMTWNDDCSDRDNSDVCDSVGGANRAWRICPGSDSKSGATINWRYHQKLIEYIMGLGAKQVSKFGLDAIGSNILNGISSPQSGLVINPMGMSNFAQANLSGVMLGDYVFINSFAGAGTGTDNHGYIVVGWGDIASCHCVIGQDGQDCDPRWNNPYQRSNLQPSFTPGTVPYVVDYSYATNRGWTQDPQPRPFYCSKFDIESYRSTPNSSKTKFPGNYTAFGNQHSWTFYHMPDEAIYIPCRRQYKLARSQ